jgi:hypothetical protein
MTEMEPRTGREDPLDAVEAEEAAVASRLRHERPRPSAAYRAELRRRLIAEKGRGPAGGFPTPLVAGCLTGGAVLMLVAAAGVAGIGPFAS